MPYPLFKGYSSALIALENQSMAKLMGVIAVSQGGGEAYTTLYNALIGSN